MTRSSRNRKLPSHRKPSKPRQKDKPILSDLRLPGPGLSRSSNRLYWRQSAMKAAFGVGLVLATACAASSAQLPKECKPPADRDQALHNNPSAVVFGETGAWF